MHIIKRKIFRQIYACEQIIFGISTSVCIESFVVDRRVLKFFIIVTAEAQNIFITAGSNLITLFIVTCYSFNAVVNFSGFFGNDVNNATHSFTAIKNRIRAFYNLNFFYGTDRNACGWIVIVQVDRCTVQQNQSAFV